MNRSEEFEGKGSKGGLNPRPTTPRPKLRPQPQPKAKLKRIILGQGYPRIFDDNTVQIYQNCFWSSTPLRIKKLKYAPAFPWDFKCRLVLEILD